MFPSKADAIAASITLSILGSFFFWIFCLNHVSLQELGLAYDPMNGHVSLQEETGWYLTSPLVRVTTIDMRPFQVCLNGGRARILNCKLIRFRADGYRAFIELQGFSYLNATEFNATMRGYAYSGQSYPFLEVMDEMKSTTLPAPY